MILARDHLETDAERVVDERDRHFPRSVRGELMLPHLLVEIELRRRKRPVAGLLPAVVVAGMRRPDDIGNRRQIAGAFRQHRMADIDVIAEHVRRPVEAVVHHPIGEPDLVASDIRLDASDQVQVLAEHRGLLDDAFAPERARVAVPALAIAGEPSGNGADAAVQR